MLGNVKISRVLTMGERMHELQPDAVRIAMAELKAKTRNVELMQKLQTKARELGLSHLNESEWIEKTAAANKLELARLESENAAHKNSLIKESIRVCAY